MMCAWKEFLAMLPPWLRFDVDALGRDTLQELRLRLKSPPELILHNKSIWLGREVTSADISFCINAASQYSPWSASTAAKGFLTAAGGHRIGICGSVVRKNGEITGIRNPDSLCLRVARDFPGIGRQLASLTGSVLIVGAPGWGKTTLLRDLCRHRSAAETLSVVDERGELFPQQVKRGKRLDVLSGCPKAEGIEMVLRTMGPECIAVDEITAEEDCTALIKASCCGVRLLATAHAASMEEFRSRIIYRPLVEFGIFDHIVILNRDKSYTAERMTS